MALKTLDKIFKPQRIAIVGVSSNVKNVGNIALKNLVSGGFNGVVYPINPKYEAVMGIQCYPDLASLPKVPDLVVICTGAKTVHGLVKQCGEAGTLGIIIMSAGFKESGESIVDNGRNFVTMKLFRSYGMSDRKEFANAVF